MSPVARPAHRTRRLHEAIGHRPRSHLRPDRGWPAHRTRRPGRGARLPRHHRSGHRGQPARPAGRKLHLERNLRQGHGQGREPGPPLRNVRTRGRQRAGRGTRQRGGHQRSTAVGGSIQLKQGGSAQIRANRVTGDVQSFTNSSAQTISKNRINGNLQCKENRPAPTGSGNIGGGNKEDQCSRL